MRIMAKIVNFDRGESLQTLRLFYREDDIIELFIGRTEEEYEKKPMPIGVGHFNDITKVLDEIAVYDRRADVAAIYSNLNRIKPGSERFSLMNKVISDKRANRG